jgi:peptidase E
MGGGGFSMEPENPALDRYVLAQARVSNPLVCFVPTASGDSKAYVRRFYRAFRKLRCRPTHLSLFDRAPVLREFILQQDIIYVGGGNTKSLLAVWRDWGLPDILREAWSKGVVLAGVSAGAMCWFDTGVTDSWAGRLMPLRCLGLLRGTCCPHYDGEAERRPSVHQLVAAGSVRNVLALDDGAAAHFVGRKLLRVVSSRTNAGAYKVHRRAGAILETLLPVTRLRKPRPAVER